jgi:hypothetical protein
MTGLGEDPGELQEFVSQLFFFVCESSDANIPGSESKKGQKLEKYS